MKTIPKTPQLQRRQQITALAMNIGLFAGLSALPLHAQDNENSRTGSSEEEWYNPGNWSNDNQTDRNGSDWWSNDGWSDSADSDDRSDNEAGNIDGESQANRNQRQNRNNAQSRWDQQQDRSDRQAGRNTQQFRSDLQARRNMQQDRSDMQTRRNQRQDRNDAQTTRNGQQDWSDRNPQAGRKQNRSMKTVTFNGTVDGFRKVNLQDSEGKQDEHTFVRIRLEDDDARVVSLGSRLIVTDLDLEKGDEISVSGRNARIDNRDVLVASSIEVDDKLFRVRKHNRPDTGQQFPITGTVKDVSMTSLSDNSREKNLLIRMELENGKTCVVDLGQGTTLSDLDIEEGSEIRLQGKKTKVDGKSIIVARTISVDGDTTRVRGTSKGHRPDNNISWEYSDQENGYESLEAVSRD